MMRRTTVPAWLAVLALLALALPLYAHVTLVATTPERNSTVEEPPSHLQLRFSGTVEARYTSVALVTPDGRELTLGDPVFLEGSDREFTVAMPALSASGTYTVRWRTAGADGHVLQGTWTFTLAASAVADTAAVPGTTTLDAPGTQDVHDLHDPREHEGVLAGVDAGAVLSRWLHFTALLLLAGAFAFRLLLLPRLDVGRDARPALLTRAWRTAAIAALLLVVAALFRLWAQSAALHGADSAWDPSLLRMMLAATGWGRAWLLQGAFIVLLFAGLAVAHLTRPQDRGALFVTVPAVLGLSTIPALSGHAAGADGGALVVLNDALHVLAGGAWLGTLALLLLAAVPFLTRRPDGGEATAAAVERFSPLALVAASLVLLTGVINALLHLPSLADLTGTPYGRTLLVKLGAVGLVGLAGFVNWRIVRPALRRGGDPRRLRMSAGVELGFALLVLLATAVLTGTPRP